MTGAVEYVAASNTSGPRQCSVVRLRRPENSHVGAEPGSVVTIMKRLTRTDAEEIAQALQAAYDAGRRDA